jgi:uncharacterized protein YrzB (UPF0473 family)
MEENKTPLENEELEEDYGADIVTLTDEDGNETEFELVDTLDTDDGSYVALISVPGEDPDAYLQSDGNLVILKYVTIDGEEMLSTIEDDAEYEKVEDIFVTRLSDLYEFEDGDEEE